MRITIRIAQAIVAAFLSLSFASATFAQVSNSGIRDASTLSHVYEPNPEVFS